MGHTAKLSQPFSLGGISLGQVGLATFAIGSSAAALLPLSSPMLIKREPGYVELLYTAYRYQWIFNYPMHGCLCSPVLGRTSQQATKRRWGALASLSALGQELSFEMRLDGGTV